jgi:hypothetical protein
VEHRRRPQRAALLTRGGSERRTLARAFVIGVVLASSALSIAPARSQELDSVSRPRLREGWDGAGAPPFGSDPIPALPLPGRPADPQRLEEARSLFATPPRERRLGSYALLTDVDDPALLDSMAAVVEQIEPLYRSRYQLDLAGEPGETIVLYRSEDAYRVLQGRSERIRGLASRGHEGWGLVVLFAGASEPRSGFTTVLRHELGHVLNRRGLGPALPPWLDEGLADDFAAHELDSAREPREAPIATMRTVERTVGGSRVEIRGSLASLDLLAKALAAGTAPDLESVLALDWKTFMEEPQATLHYAASAWLVRYLLDRRSGAGDRFHAFLDRIALGASGEPRDLETALGKPMREIEAGWRVYVAWRALGAGVGPSAGASASGAADRSGLPDRDRHVMAGSAQTHCLSQQTASGSSSRQLDSPSA